jgi:hypothetical protein
VRISWYASADGSGSQIEVAESTGSASSAWTELSTGPVQAPAEASSARVRLTLQPLGGVAACFDDAVFFVTDAPEVSPTEVPAIGQEPTKAGVTRTATAVRTGTAPQGTRTPATSRTASPGRTVDIGGTAALRISEILSDPAEPGRDAAYEWVEIFNAGTEPADLAGWSIGDGTRAQVLAAQSLAPGGYLVVAGESAPLPATIAVVRVPGGEIGNGLGNTGDVVRLTAPDGSVADEVSYGDNDDVFDPPPPEPASGKTIGLTEPGADAASENWAITLRPTPGEPNVFPPGAPSTVAGVVTQPPDSSGQHGQPVVSVATGGGDGSMAPWVILIGAGGISAGVAGGVWGRKAGAVWSRLRG